MNEELLIELQKALIGCMIKPHYVLDKILPVLNKQTLLLKNTSVALQNAYEHLEWCGYGDNYERECANAKGLSSELETALEDVSEYLFEKGL